MNSFKTFDNFGAGLKEITQLIPEIKTIATAINEDVTVITPKELAGAFVNIVMNDFPFADFRSPAVSISFKEVGFKSRSVLSFGWKYVNDGNGSLQYSFRISFFSHSETVQEIERKLAELEWKQVAEKRNYFPYKNHYNGKEKHAKNDNAVNNNKKKFNNAPKKEAANEAPSVVEEAHVEKAEVPANTSSEY